MTKRHSAKEKISRRLGVNLWGRPKSPYGKDEAGPGQHGANKRRKLSDFGTQLRAKQRLKGYYGNIGERQFRKYYLEAARRKGDTGENLIGILERRIDMVIYRMKFVPTVFAARQFVNHGHIKINGKRVTIPSYLLKVGDTVEIKDKSKELALVMEAIETRDGDVPPYLEADSKAKKGKFVRVPNYSEVPYAAPMSLNLVVEYYSR